MARLLILDEDNFFINSVNFFFANEGYTIETSQDGKVGMELIEKNNFDVIICNTQLRHKSGYEVARAIKQIDAKKNIPIIMVSPANNIVSLNSNDEALYDAYLQKPINFITLKEKIQELANRKLQASH